MNTFFKFDPKKDNKLLTEFAKLPLITLITLTDAFWVADPVVLKAFWCAGELDRSSHPIPPERSTMRWPKEIPWSPKHLFMQPVSRQSALVCGASSVTVKLKARSLR